MVLRVIIFSLATFISGVSLYDANKKKIDKTLAKVWPEQQFLIIDQNHDGTFRGEYYKVFSSDSLLAHLIIDEAPGKVDNFSYMIVFTPDAKIASVNVLEYRENYGGEIASKRFLKQYIGKKNGESMKYLKDIDGISGATISVRALNQGVSRNSISLYDLINSK